VYVSTPLSHVFSSDRFILWGGSLIARGFLPPSAIPLLRYIPKLFSHHRATTFAVRPIIVDRQLIHHSDNSSIIVFTMVTPRTYRACKKLGHPQTLKDIVVWVEHRAGVKIATRIAAVGELKPPMTLWPAGTLEVQKYTHLLLPRVLSKTVVLDRSQ